MSLHPARGTRISAPAHDWAGLFGADLADGAVEDLGAVEEVDHVDGQPVVEGLGVGLLHALLQVRTGL